MRPLPATPAPLARRSCVRRVLAVSLRRRVLALAARVWHLVARLTLHRRMAVFVASVVVAMHLAFATLDWEAVHQSTDATIEERRGTVVVVGHHLDKVVPRGQLVREVWGPSYDEDFEGLRVYVYRLRRKLERGPDPPEFLATMPSVGYMLQARPTTP